ncbi:hypothetical protein, partial [Treponema endosymbiont of Eucomonympha sp.]|uniref:hypothetical protein n=1 Tax=Treponema endosymbiont of Eucomonympha sp. TaxID=1580831 RepID=UPI001EE72BE5
ARQTTAQGYARHRLPENADGNVNAPARITDGYAGGVQAVMRPHNRQLCGRGTGTLRALAYIPRLM